MSDYDKTIVTGRLTRNPELRYTPQGDAVCNFSLAVNRFNDITIWYRVTAWGKVAENCNNYLEKGRTVLVEGQLTPDKETGNPKIWTDSNGNPRAGYDLRAITIQFLGGGSQRDNGQQSGQAQKPEPEMIDENEVPF